MFRLFYTLMFLVFCLAPSWASTFILPEEGDVIGELQYAYSEIGETINDVGLRYGVGYVEMVRANPHIDARRSLSPGTKIVIPSCYLLPSGPREGLVINLAEYRLYYFPPGDNVVITMPIGIGKAGWHTPVGKTTVVARERDPVWRPTANIKAAASEKGVLLPNQFPPGKHNPLGRHILRLGWPTYLIHGTNRRDGVGMRVSAGCIRLMPEDIEQLFDQVAVGTPVRVINEPVKIGWQHGALYLEVHPLLLEQKNTSLHVLFERLAAGIRSGYLKNNRAIKKELDFPTGIPMKINS
ncbi:L,D-transpeptidase family protein [Legionella spiritensis]|uniref:Putative ErfK/YbiS/YcfS/YnhG family protein n=1 Tax=Legionella spiritensis TaxID=452 RepID=A0A0W0Z475_LEGSP|nr:L,D-transpeptidase family protein [Legionella spiritensis]KTD63925.1 putative ErfK/YbiS/YcfS/YnhG family protein precursor [Legionella spiritensis]SNV36585.1 putative ErfK/YbiS/YcfS/YnhG family protein precursor [Legionella spiritensis]